MLIEAMASGAVPIATNIGGTLDIVRDGENGFLFVPNDVTNLAMLIQKTRQGINFPRVIEQAVQSAREVSVEKIAKQTVALYNGTLSIGRTRR